MRTRYFFGFIISFAFGVFIDDVLDLGISFALFLGMLSLVLTLARDVKKKAPASFLVSLILLGAALGVFRIDVSRMQSGAGVLDSFVNKTATVEGILAGEPDVREEYTNIVLDVERVLYGDGEYALEKKVRFLVRVPAYPEFVYGDRVSVLGKIVSPKNFTPDDGTKSFDYVGYLAKDHIYYQMFFPRTRVVAHGEGNTLQEKLFALKAWLIKNIAAHIPEPEAALAAGITLGAKQSLGKDLMNKFRETGVAHIVVLSGYNIAVVAGAVSRILVFAPFATRLVLGAAAIVLFAMMVGGGATVVRAALMALVVILARMLGRESDALRVLVLAGALMILMNPLILLHDVSFQLSFVATLAIVVFVPVIEKYFLFVSSRVLREIIVATFATQIFVLPLILYHMGSVSLVGFVANIFILPFVPIAMLLVGLVSMLGGVPIIASVFAYGAYALLAYVIALVEFFARVPFAALTGVSFSIAMLVVAYGGLAFMVVKNFSRTKHEERPSYEF